MRRPMKLRSRRSKVVHNLLPTGRCATLWHTVEPQETSSDHFWPSAITLRSIAFYPFKNKAAEGT
jgi:hypothetical protein